MNAEERAREELKAMLTGVKATLQRWSDTKVPLLVTKWNRDQEACVSFTGRVYIAGADLLLVPLEEGVLPISVSIASVTNCALVDLGSGTGAVHGVPKEMLALTRALVSGVWLLALSLPDETCVKLVEIESSEGRKMFRSFLLDSFAAPASKVN